MLRASSKHRALGRSIAELDTRNPSLVDAVDSAPVVGPLASPLVGDGSGSGAQPSTSPGPQPTPTPTSGSGSSGDGEENANSGGDGDGGGSDNEGGNVHGANAPSPTTSPSGGGGNAALPASIAPSATSPNSLLGQPTSSSSVKNASSVSGGANPSNPSNSGGSLGAGSGQAAPANVSPGPSINSLAPGASAAVATGTLLPSQYSQGTGSRPVGTATASLIPASATVLSGKQLSRGGIAGITLACLFLALVIIFLVLRRRSIAHRLELRKQWWINRSTSGHSITFPNRRSPRSPIESNGEVSHSGRSVRSSFATNFDQGLMFRISSPSTFLPGHIPDVPPTAEVRERNSASVSTGDPVAYRESMNSMLSSGSDSDAQYLVLSTGQNHLEPSTPMSVRPFSPSESFAFPKPPVPLSSIVDTFITPGTPALASSRSSATTLVHLSTPPRAFMGDLPSPSVLASFHPQPSVPGATLSSFAVAADHPTDPFADPAKPEFSEVEVVRRPFAPSLDDELSVRPGDHVCIFRVFDDGWAFVEKLADAECKRHERGLIPVDCFRQVDKSLPTFLAEKRVSYGSDKLMAYGL